MDRISFPVVQKRLQTEDGLKAPVKAIIRTDSNVILGVVGLDYKMVPHKEVVEGIEKYIPTTLENRRFTLCRDGAILFAFYSTPLIGDAEIRDGDVIKFGLEAFNSYNGELAVGFMLRAKRVQNGAFLFIPKSIATISMRHRGGLNLPEIKDEFLKRMPLFMQTAMKWKEWSTITPKQDDIVKFLDKVVGERLQKELLEKYNSQFDKTVWGLYNVLANYATNEIKLHKNNEDNKRVSQFNFEKKVFSAFYFIDW